MKHMRTILLLTLALLLATTATLASNRPPSDAVLLMRDGSLVKGDVFTINRQSVSMRTDDGIFNYKRRDVSQVVFNADSNALVLGFEGQFVDNTTLSGELSYVGGVWDGHPAGSFTSSITADPADPKGERLLVRTTFHVERNTLPRGSLNTLTVSDGVLVQTKVDGITQNHMAGVIHDGTGDYEGCYGTVESVMQFRLGDPNVDSEGFFIFRFDNVHRTSLL